MSLPWAYSFKSQLTFEQIRARLAELGHGDWEERDSDVYGGYIRGHLWGVRMRIFDGKGSVSEFGSYSPRGFMLLDYAKRAPAGPDHDARLRDELFAALAVTEWKPAEPND